MNDTAGTVLCILYSCCIDLLVFGRQWLATANEKRGAQGLTRTNMPAPGVVWCLCIGHAEKTGGLSGGRPMSIALGRSLVCAIIIGVGRKGTRVFLIGSIFL